MQMEIEIRKILHSFDDHFFMEYVSNVQQDMFLRAMTGQTKDCWTWPDLVLEECERRRKLKEEDDASGGIQDQTTGESRGPENLQGVSRSSQREGGRNLDRVRSKLQRCGDEHDHGATPSS